VAVFGLPDPQWGHSVNAAVVVNQPINTEALQQWMKEKIADYKRPKQYFFVTELPKTSLGKIQREHLVALYTP
jgi:acyl-coenzyme A synthetase/AMP-(fatty) acid ligase